MRSIGLQPTSTGKDDGAEIDDVMGHIIVADSSFDRTVRKMLAKALVVSWIEQSEKKPRRTRIPRTIKRAKARAASASVISARPGI